jgi:hypothetical protein
MRKLTNTLSLSPKGFQSPKFSDSGFREVRGLGLGRPKSSAVSPRCLYNKVGFQWGFFVSCGSQKRSATRWRSNQVSAVRAANARWHPTAIICTRDGAAPTWSLFVMFQKNVIVVVGWVSPYWELPVYVELIWAVCADDGDRPLLFWRNEKIF